MHFERPRVRAEGPGGPDVKQGARIACLDCRSAKIRCSAPTDGKVPCRRCERHGKECVFEKHRRGRKPGRTSNHLKTAAVSSSGARINESRALSTVEPSFMRPIAGERHHQGHISSASTSYHPEQQQQHHHHHPHHPHQNGYMRSGAGLSPAAPGWSPPLPDERLPPTSVVSPVGGRTSRPDTFTVQPPLSASRYAPDASPRHHEASHYNLTIGLGSARDHGDGPLSHSSPAQHTLSASPVLSLGHQRGHHLHLPLPLPQHQQSPSLHLPSPGAVSSANSTRSWLDFPTPSGSRSLFSPSNILATTTTTTATSGSQGAGHHSQSPFWPGSAATVSSPHNKRKLTGDYFSGVSPVHSVGAGAAGERASSAHRPFDEKAANRIVAAAEQNWKDQDAKRPRLDEGVRSTGRQTNSEEDEDNEDEEIDQLDEDEVGGGHNDDVLSTPLRLLAHASDAAEAIKGGARTLLNPAQEDKSNLDSISSSSNGHPRRPFSRLGTGAATMGLVSPPVPRLDPLGRRLDSMRLPTLGRPGTVDSMPRLAGNVHRSLYHTLARDQPSLDRSQLPYNTPTSSGRMMAPPFMPPFSKQAAVSSSLLPPPPLTLGTLGRSRSYTTVESLARMEPLSSPRAREEVPKPKVTEVERRAEVLGIPSSLNSASPSPPPPRAISATTLEPESWEYRNGRARTRKSHTNGNSQASAGSESVKSGEEDSASAQAAHVSAPRRDSDVAKKQMDEAEGKKAPRRWVVTKRRKSIDEKRGGESESESESERSEQIGASHREFFSLSLYHSKLDNDDDLDPVRQEILDVKELEKLFDTFFARINPQLNLLDPFLHSVAYVRNRSALLTTVVAALAARLCESPRDAELAVSLERYWRENLLPEVLLEGYKSVELSQAFLVLSLYHKPTNRLADDRSWQYLGFAIRIATEVGVNRRATLDEGVKDNEQFRRRIRNRSRLWINLFLCDRALSSQTGRPHTIQEDAFIVNSSSWHREEYALPEDVCLVSLMKLRRLVGQHCDAFDQYLLGDDSGLLQGSKMSKTIVCAKERMAGLQYWRMKANADLEKWKDTWCLSSLEEAGDTDGAGLRSMSAVLVGWRFQAFLCYLHARLHLNSIVLQEMEKWHAILLAAASAEGSVESGVKDRGIEESRATKEEDERDMVTPVAHDCWTCASTMIDVLLDQIDEEHLAAAPNQTAIMSTWSALAALRLTKKPDGGSGNRAHRRGKQYVWADRKTIVEKSRRLAKALIKAGRTPEHRNGAAAPYGLYLEGIVSLWESSTPVLEKEQRLHAENSPEEAISPEAVRHNSPKVRLAPEKEDDDKNAEGDAMSSTSAVNEDDQRPSSSPSAATSRSVHDGISTGLSSRESTQQHKKAGENEGQENDEEAEVKEHAASNTDRLWDYLSTYPDPSSGFPLSLWQPQPAWSTTTPAARNVPSSSTTSSLNATTASS